MPAGRPRKIRSLKRMRELIEQYFRECEGRIALDEEGHAITDKYNNPIIIGQKPPTVAGLALALGFKSRQTLLNYQGDPRFEEEIALAKCRIEEYVESRLFDRDGASGAKFSLINNFQGWKPERMAIVVDEPENYGVVELAAAPEADAPEEYIEDNSQLEESGGDQE